MEKVFINIKLETENDVYFGISNTILSYDKKKYFTIDDIVKELLDLNWGPDVFEKWNIRKMIEISLQNLIEHGKVVEEPRCYWLKDC